jgi:RNA polymerase sigma-70 factor (ECF subfamily)
LDTPGSHADFDDFYQVASPRLVQRAFAMCGDLGVAQDLVQEAFVRAWLRWHKLRHYDDLDSWLRLVVTNLVTDRWRWLSAQRRALRRTGPLPPVAPPGEDGVLLASALRHLPPPQRRAIVLHYLYDLPIAAIAEETGASAGTVKSWLWRGRRECRCMTAGRSPAQSPPSRCDPMVARSDYAWPQVTMSVWPSSTRPMATAPRSGTPTSPSSCPAANAMP